MKKIIAIVVSALFMTASTFALGLSAGVKGNLGKTMSNDWAEVVTEFGEMNINSELEAGFGGYVNVSLFGGLGVQAEVDVVKNTFKFQGEGLKDATDTTKYEAKDYEAWLVDIPLMLWGNVDLGPLRLGLGVGPNFSFNLDATDRASFETVYEKANKVYTEKLYTMGLALGLDGKFYISDNFGIVASTRYLGNFDKTTASYPIENGPEVEYPSVEFKRNSFYAGIGLEFKLF